MGFRTWREHRHYMNALNTLEQFSNSHTFSEASVQQQPERGWQQGVGRREWVETQSILGQLTTTDAVDIEYVRIIHPAPVIQLPEQRAPAEIDITQVEVAI